MLGAPPMYPDGAAGGCATAKVTSRDQDNYKR